MKKLIFTMAALMLCAISAHAQYYPFGSNFTCVCQEGDSLAYVDAKEKLKATMDLYQESGDLYGYDVDFHMHKNEDAADSAHFSIVMFSETMEEFEAKKEAWEKANPEAMALLTKKCPERTDEQLWDQSVSLPVIKDMGAMVVDASEVDYSPDPNIDYNIVVDFTMFVKEDLEEEHSHTIDPSSVNWGISDIGRQINLHVGAGIPQENVNIVVAVHGLSSQSFMTNEAYQAKHEMDNPNIKLINELTDAGVQFMICSQSLGNIKKADLLSNVKLTLTAQTVLSEYQMKGYALKVIENE